LFCGKTVLNHKESRSIPLFMQKWRFWSQRVDGWIKVVPERKESLQGQFKGGGAEHVGECDRKIGEWKAAID
jgi:hypothetical protein